MRAVAFVCIVFASANAWADERLDLELPDLPLLESAFHLDRGEPYEHRTNRGFIAWVGAGGARADDGDAVSTPTATGAADPRPAFVGSTGLALGRHDENFLALWRSELYGVSGRGIRGWHRALVQAHSPMHDDLGIGASFAGTVEHGDARGLGPVRIGPGPRVTGDADFDAMVRLSKHRHDMNWVAAIGGQLGGTAWQTTTPSTPDRESHDTAWFALGGAPFDDEIPRGRVDIMRIGIEHQTVSFRPGTGMDDGKTRTFDIMAGAKDLTFYVDHEAVAIVNANVGGSAVKAGDLTATALKAQFSGAVKWWRSDGIVRTVGLDLSRLPTTSPDAKRIIGDTRFEIENAVETTHLLVSARGGVSWLESLAGGMEGDKTLVRYGMELESYWKLFSGIEAGVYHANSYEPRVTGDPWATPRRWTVETGALVRVRR